MYGWMNNILHRHLEMGHKFYIDTVSYFLSISLYHQVVSYIICTVIIGYSLNITHCLDRH